MNTTSMFIGLITRTENPMAPLQVGKLGNAIEALAPTLKEIANREQVEAYMEVMCDSIKDVDKVSNSPEFVLALMAMLIESLKGFTADCAESVS